ncbi:MAG: hypothetical protein G3M78_07330 [Candidatus Nitrohelix vancouverensis]|uniref:Uncharacterized protein n=1 Tax=Candidatus Nitrohelix vancouverensis TaxID=2705534 RepID=A0A7T0G3A3_9BACT|nr:MAG: hypothetical protein G3M78_07330 [Candidatus Nitrohelix vancouverensis]
MNEFRFFFFKVKPPLSLWQTTGLLCWILVKLILVAAMISQSAGEFIYAGF